MAMLCWRLLSSCQSYPVLSRQIKLTTPSKWLTGLNFKYSCFRKPPDQPWMNANMVHVNFMLSDIMVIVDVYSGLKVKKKVNFEIYVACLTVK